MTTPANYRDDTADMFDDSFRNIDLDTNGHAGAIGLYAPMAQRSMIAQVRVVATGSHTGIWGFPGRSSISLDVEVEGGQYGIRTDSFPGLTPAAGSCITGLRLYNQTVAPIVVGDFVPLVVVGFDIQPAANVSAYVVTEATATGSAVASFIDGQVVLSGSQVAFDNTVLKGMYLRNVYVNGVNNIIRSGTTTHTATGTWKRIAEYSSNDLDGAASPANGATALRSRSLINGTIDRIQEPVNSIESNASAPPSNIVTQHIPRIHDIDDGDAYILITDPPYSAVSSASRSGTDARSAIQSAIAAAVTAGHGRVFIPKGANGLFYVGSPGINLPAGLNAMWSNGHLGRGGIGVHSSWAPTSGSPAVITTDNNASAATQLHSLTIEIRCIGGTGGNSTTPYQYDRFSHIQWRAGQASTTFWIEYDKEFVTPTIPCNTRIVLDISANGGGRHYGTETDGRGRAAVGHRVVRATSTTEPLAFYGLSGETSKGNAEAFNPSTNFEFSGASNVRLYSMKREGTSTTAIIDDCTNFAAYSSGAMRQPDSVGTGYWQITGTSNGITIANVLVQSYDGTSLNRPTLIEDLDASAAFSIIWPEGVSLYKRGTIDDSLMVFT